MTITFNFNVDVSTVYDSGPGPHGDPAIAAILDDTYHFEMIALYGEVNFSTVLNVILLNFWNYVGTMNCYLVNGGYY